MALIGSWDAGEAVLAWDPVRELVGDPFAALDLPAVPDRDGRDDEPADEPDDEPDGGFGGGWIGCWGYRLGGDPGRVPGTAPRPVPRASHRVGFYDRVLRRHAGQWWFEQLLGVVAPADERSRADSFLAALRRPDPARRFSTGPFEMTPSPAAHQAAVDRVRELIVAGEVFQVNLTARLEAAFTGDPLDLFCAGVARLRPAYAAYVGDETGAVASLSPELFLRRTGDTVRTSPIKGTAPLETDPALLTSSAKDRAENVMIVDLMRNDLGRVAVPGTVRVPSLVRAERHAVWHLVSDVTATLRPGTSTGDLLQATFPPGSVTGAPKVRAMQVIDDLESTGREAYTGAVGYVSPVAGLELNVAIRTFEVAAGRVWLGVGGGVVVDSTPEREFQECLTKARPLVAAIGGALAPDLTGPDPEADPAPRPTTRPTTEPTTQPTNQSVADPEQGVFDTMLVRDGEPVALTAHLDRLRASTTELYGLGLPDDLAAAVRARCAGLQGPHRLRVDATPDAGRLRVRLSARPLAADPEQVVLTPHRLSGGLGAHKWADRRSIHRPDRPAGGLLLLDGDGSVLETDTASLFAVFDDGVRTPPLDGRTLPGTTRARVLDVLARHGLPVQEQRLETADLAEAAEVFTTNALRGVRPVTAVTGVGRWRPGATTAWLRARLTPLTGAAAVGAPAGAPVTPVAARVLVVDNYDSFVYNLAQYVGQLGAEPTVVRNDALTVADAVALRVRGGFTHLLLSPGPGDPSRAGICVPLVRALGATTPVLGVCLGHQAIVEAYGGRVVRAERAVHGRPAIVHHDGAGVYTGLNGPRVVGRYHSLVGEEASLPADLVVTSHTPSGVVMGVRHRRHPVEGVQWHPESVLTHDGHAALASFLAVTGAGPGAGSPV